MATISKKELNKECNDYLDRCYKLLYEAKEFREIIINQFKNENI